MSFAAMAHLTEELCLNALLTLKMENSRIGLVGTRLIQSNSILYFNVLPQQLREPITESAQEDKYIHSTEINIKMRTKLN
jgi:hypothetical protein